MAGRYVLAAAVRRDPSKIRNHKLVLNTFVRSSEVVITYQCSARSIANAILIPSVQEFLSLEDQSKTKIKKKCRIKHKRIR